MKRWWVVLLAGAVATAFAQTLDRYGRVPGSGHQGDEEEKLWQEQEIEPPAFPKPEDLKEFYVSAVASNN